MVVFWVWMLGLSPEIFSEIQAWFEALSAEQLYRTILLI